MSGVKPNGPPKGHAPSRERGSFWTATRDVWLGAIDLVRPAVHADASPEQRGTAIVLLTIVLGLFVCLGVLFLGRTENNGWAGSVTVIVIVGGFAAAGWISRRVPQPAVPQFQPWCRTVVRWPLSAENAAELGILLGNVRNRAIEYFASRQNAVTADLIRANIFLPDYISHQDGKTLYVLRCPSELTRAMVKADARLTLLPGEGLSGAVFITGEPRSTTNRLDGLWTDENKRLVSTDLQWIVSQPLKNSRHVTLGVLNIDGRKVEITERQLDGLGAFVAEDLERVAAYLAQVPICELRVSAQEC